MSLERFWTLFVISTLSVIEQYTLEISHTFTGALYAYYFRFNALPLVFWVRYPPSSVENDTEAFKLMSHSHMSEMYAINTKVTSLTEPLRRFVHQHKNLSNEVRSESQ
jgi:hypothetical protein